jgi:hypothetical protein
VKPQQCRDFPNLWNFPGSEKDCRAIPRLVSEPEYRRLVALATGRDEHEVESPVNSAVPDGTGPTLHPATQR